jgi:NADH-quinone oxidoreductase subunit I
MKVGRPELSLLKKIFMVDLIKGLLLTFWYQRPSANYTEQYPKVRPKIAERFRGAPRLNNDPDTGETLCIACNLCALACPTPCIELTQEFELSLYGRRDMKLDRQQLEEGVQPVIYTK